MRSGEYKYTITLMPFPTNSANSVVVDGNHRITSKKHFKTSTSVNVKVLNKMQATELLQNNFEKAYYTYMCEGLELTNGRNVLANSEVDNYLKLVRG